MENFRIMNKSSKLKSELYEPPECETPSKTEQENKANADWIHKEVYEKLECGAFLLLLYDSTQHKPKLELEIRCGLDDREVAYLQKIAKNIFFHARPVIIMKSLIEVNLDMPWNDTYTLLDARWLDKNIALCTFLCKSRLPAYSLIEYDLTPILRSLCKVIQIEVKETTRASTKAIPQNIIPVSIKNYNLTPREIEVLQWVWEGKSNSVIAIILQCSQHTIKTHLQRTYEKTGENSRLRAAKKVFG